MGDGSRGNAIRGYLRSLNLKKIHVEYVRGGTVHISKLDRTIPFTAEPDGVIRHIRLVENPTFNGGYSF